jgi:hypothetical protein
MLCERLTSAKLEGAPGALDGADDFTTAYVQALFFTDNAVNADDGRTFEAQAADDETENEGSFPNSATVEDIAPETLELSRPIAPPSRRKPRTCWRWPMTVPAMAAPRKPVTIFG